LAVWEPDPKRRAAMHGRRVDMLAPLLDALNPAVYISLVKELGIEAGSAAQEQFDARCTRLEARMAAGEGGAELRADGKAANDTADRAIKLYGSFLQCYNDARLAGAPIDGRNTPLPPVHGATALDDPSVNAYITAHFCVARLLGRRLGLDPAEKLEDLRASLARYTWLHEHAGAIVPAGTSWGVDYMPQEAAMCAEMMRLLPQQIAQLHYRGVDVSARRMPGGGVGLTGAAGAAQPASKSTSKPATKTTSKP
jgi:hypothetical protein